MTEYRLRETKRRSRQLISAAVFVMIIIGGWLWPVLGYFIPLCMLLGIGIGVFQGRKWCDWLCPRGSFYDVALKPISQKQQIPELLRRNKLRIAVLALLMLIMVSNLIARWMDPVLIGKFFVTMLTVTTILGVILALFFHQRSWCYLCPIGSMISWIGGKRLPLKIIPHLCNDCQLCSRVCPMQLAPSRHKKNNTGIVAENDCLKCNLCVLVCPNKALTRDKGV